MHGTRPLGLLVVALALGCHTPLIRTEAGSLESDGETARDVHERPGIGKQILLYLPNRIVDLVDTVHFPIVPLSVGVGPDIRITRWLQLSAQVGAGAAVGLDDRSHEFFWVNTSATAALGPWRTGVGIGTAPSLGDWEVGVAGGATKFAIDLAEIVDFVLGWFFIDVRKDDYGWE